MTVNRRRNTMPLPCPKFPEKCETAQRCHLYLPLECIFSISVDNPNRKKNRKRCCVTEDINNLNKVKDDAG